jgi:hypothetical protein
LNVRSKRCRSKASSTLVNEGSGDVEKKKIAKKKKKRCREKACKFIIDVHAFGRCELGLGFSEKQFSDPKPKERSKWFATQFSLSSVPLSSLFHCCIAQVGEFFFPSFFRRVDVLHLDEFRRRKNFEIFIVQFFSFWSLIFASRKSSSFFFKNKFLVNNLNCDPDSVFGSVENLVEG